jgi:hypothetical protein
LYDALDESIPRGVGPAARRSADVRKIAMPVAMPARLDATPYIPALKDGVYGAWR